MVHLFCKVYSLEIKHKPALDRKWESAAWAQPSVVCYLHLMVNRKDLMFSCALFLLLSVYFKPDEPLCCCTGSDNERATAEESKGEAVIDGAVWLSEPWAPFSSRLHVHTYHGSCWSAFTKLGATLRPHKLSQKLNIWGISLVSCREWDKRIGQLSCLSVKSEAWLVSIKTGNGGNRYSGSLQRSQDLPTSTCTAQWFTCCILFVEYVQSPNCKNDT